MWTTILALGVRADQKRAHESLRINSFPDKPWVYVSAVQLDLLKTLGKREIARNEQLLIFTVFSNHLENILPLHQIENCRLQTLSVWKSTFSYIFFCLLSDNRRKATLALYGPVSAVN